MRVTASYLSPEQARRLYDRVGRWQGTQAFYEHRATRELIELGRFEEAYAVFEFGCGTGRFAARILAHHLPQQAGYLGVDASPVMVRLAAERLRPWGDRAEVRQSDGSMRLPAGDGQFDRFVANYVLDLLSPDDARELVSGARRMLAPGGLVCLTSLSASATGLSSLVARAWERVWRLRPHLVGGCRPIDATEYIARAEWTVVHRRVVTTLGLASEVVIARRTA